MKNLINKILGRYTSHPEAVIISCFFNPMKSSYRLEAFEDFYDSIKHLNHYIVECVIGKSKPQLSHHSEIHRIYTESLLWHKEAILNGIVKKLPKKYKYVFWIDADVFFKNKNWLVEGVKQLENFKIIQPFSYCAHLEKDQLEPDFDVIEKHKEENLDRVAPRERRTWKSFCATYVSDRRLARNDNYDIHGHVGFAWGARRSVLERCPLYDKALIGGADHIVAHAAAGDIYHSCIKKSFTEDLDAVLEWSKEFDRVISGSIGYVDGVLYHRWHGDIKQRDYFKRIREFTPKAKGITKKDDNGLYVSSSKEDQRYIKGYFRRREVCGGGISDIDDTDDGFMISMMMGYATNDGFLGGALGGNLAGGMIGDALNTSEDDFGSEPSHHSHDSIPAQAPVDNSINSDCVDSCDCNGGNFS